MKGLIALGVSFLLLLFARAVHRSGASQQALPGREAPRPESAMAGNSHVPRSPSHRLPFAHHMQSSFAGSMEQIDADLDLDARNEAIQVLAASVSDADLPKLLDFFVQDASPAAVELRDLMVRRWAGNDVRAAAAWTGRLVDTPAFRAAACQVAIAWASLDLGAAVEWVRAMPAGEDQLAATLVLGYEAARAEPVTAIDLAAGLPPSRERDNLLVHAISQWAGSDAATATAWAMDVPEADLRQRLVGAVAVASAEQHSAAAATLAANSLETGEEQDRAAISIVQRWAQQSPNAAASWILQFPDTPSRDAAAQNLLELWTVQSPEAAGNWLRELPAGSLRDVALNAYARVLADRLRSKGSAQPGGVPLATPGDSPEIP